jgi:hypothetical protein
LIGRSWVSSLAAAFPFPFDMPFPPMGVGTAGVFTARKHGFIARLTRFTIVLQIMLKGRRTPKAKHQNTMGTSEQK